MDQALTPAFNQFDSIMNSLKQTTGMTSEEIYKLAMERNVNLYDTTLKLNDATKALGVGMVKTSKQFSDALKDVQIKAMDVFKRFTENKAMKDALQASGDNLRGGDTSTEAFLDYYTKYLDFSNCSNCTAGSFSVPCWLILLTNWVNHSFSLSESEPSSAFLNSLSL